MGFWEQRILYPARWYVHWLSTRVCLQWLTLCRQLTLQKQAQSLSNVDMLKQSLAEPALDPIGDTDSNHNFILLVREVCSILGQTPTAIQQTMALEGFAAAFQDPSVEPIAKTLGLRVVLPVLMHAIETVPPFKKSHYLSLEADLFTYSSSFQEDLWRKAFDQAVSLWVEHPSLHLVLLRLFVVHGSSKLLRPDQISHLSGLLLSEIASVSSDASEAYVGAIAQALFSAQPTFVAMKAWAAKITQLLTNKTLSPATQRSLLALLGQACQTVPSFPFITSTELHRLLQARMISSQSDLAELYGNTLADLVLASNDPALALVAQRSLDVCSWALNPLFAKLTD